MDSYWPKEQPYSPHLLHQGYNHKNWSQKRKMSPLSPKSENLCFCPNLCYLIGSLTHSLVKIIPLDHFDVNIDGIISNLEYWRWKLFYNSVFCRHWKMKTKLWFVHFSSSQRWSITMAPNQYPGYILGLFWCHIRFRASGLIWRENLKNEQNMPKSGNIQNLCYLPLTAYISGK